MGSTIPVRDLRRKALMTQEQLAEQIGVSRVTLCHYETGRRRIPVSLLPEIRDALGCSWAELFGEEGDSETED